MPALEALRSLPTPLSRCQCVIYKDEILICGGDSNNNCYSYSTAKNEYKYICSYPEKLKLEGHCVVRLPDNKDWSGITLLSFGGGDKDKKHTLQMKYKSVWDDESSSSSSKVMEDENVNKWVKSQKKIGTEEDDYRCARALVGGSNNHLLFITYYPKYIAVFNLNTFEREAKGKFELKVCANYHCFVSNGDQGIDKMARTNANAKKAINEMLLFRKEMGLLIQYDEKNRSFDFREIGVCDDIKGVYDYGFVRVRDKILFFGGSTWIEQINVVHGYSMTTKQWTKFDCTLPSALKGCTAVLSADNTFVHILGGNGNSKDINTHIKMDVSKWIDHIEAQDTVGDAKVADEDIPTSIEADIDV
ncbi:hypothetical protein RFI_32341 [Reticulomyxa filosa]|uniref:Kelch motif family protein n=1 Tax=Reticulomyxa filosa TaxID=46433 RepID=X6LUJ7_RETFI|nr:hypothetical protein RFI_32341 [Reticulomyxa filosa]|eukprot:ETO05056.1 hypothetical protein RFI_32341 [Reticulomyxa filosa]